MTDIQNDTEARDPSFRVYRRNCGFDFDFKSVKAQILH